jgi:hypothetical protein
MNFNETRQYLNGRTFGTVENAVNEIVKIFASLAHTTVTIENVFDVYVVASETNYFHAEINENGTVSC